MLSIIDWLLEADMRRANTGLNKGKVNRALSVKQSNSENAPGYRSNPNSWQIPLSDGLKFCLSENIDSPDGGLSTSPGIL